jgi:hypothetical protein
MKTDSEREELLKRVSIVMGEVRACVGKKKYQTERAAKRAAERKTKKAPHKLSHYPCPFCYNWHIGREMSEEQLQEFDSYYEDHVSQSIGRTYKHIKATV